MEHAHGICAGNRACTFNADVGDKAEKEIDGVRDNLRHRIANTCVEIRLDRALSASGSNVSRAKHRSGISDCCVNTSV